MAGVAEVGLGHLRSLSWVVVAELEGLLTFQRSPAEGNIKKFNVVM